MLHRILAFSLISLVTLAPRASADPLLPVNCITAPCIDFAALTSSGTLSYAGGSAPLEGSNIVVEGIWGFGTPDNNLDRLDVTDGVLTFTTGAFVDFDLVTGYEFAGGGSFLIEGIVPEVGIDTVSTLAEGSFFSATFRPGAAPVNVGIFGIDVKHPAIVTHFGLDPDLPFHFGGPLGTGPILTTPGPAGGAFSVDVLTVDIPNVPIPEPASILLLGTGAAGLLARARRKSRARGGVR